MPLKFAFLHGGESSMKMRGTNQDVFAREWKCELSGFCLNYTLRPPVFHFCLFAFCVKANRRFGGEIIVRCNFFFFFFFCAFVLPNGHLQGNSWFVPSVYVAIPRAHEEESPNLEMLSSSVASFCANFEKYAIWSFCWVLFLFFFGM